MDPMNFSKATERNCREIRLVAMGKVPLVLQCTDPPKRVE